MSGLNWQYVDEGLSSEVPDLKVCVIGCGGGGCNSINRLNRIGSFDATTVAVNTDRRHLRTIVADQRLLISNRETHGFGAGGDPEVGRSCAEAATEALQQMLWGTDLTIITVGEGGGTGTGSAPVVAEVARRCGSLVMAIATRPFDFERGRGQIADEGIRRLNRFCDTVLVMDNSRLMDMVPNLPVGQAFGVMDQLISESIRALIEALTRPSLINLDFSDLRTIIRQGGMATLLFGENTDPVSVVDDALSTPLIQVDFRGATGALIHVTGGNNLTMKRVDKVLTGMTEQLDESANVICGARIDPEYGSTIRVMAMLTGIPEGVRSDIDRGLLVTYER